MKPDTETPSRQRRVLVAWGTKLGGTAEIARMIGEVLEREGYAVELAPAAEVRDASSYDAVVVGGALYANRWHRDARRFVSRNVDALRRVPVWLFSSGPLDDSADRREIPPVSQVAALMDRVGARGHATFGGRLRADVKGFPAAAMAKTMSGDWQNPERIRAWAAEVARAIPGARPGVAIELPARSPGRLVAHGVLGAAVCAAVLAGLLRVASIPAAVSIHAVLAPLIFMGLAIHYFRPRGARDPLPVALIWAATAGALDAIVFAGVTRVGLEVLASFTAIWLPFGLVFLATWLTGLVMSTLPWPKPSSTPRGDRDAHASLGRT